MSNLCTRDSRARALKLSKFKMSSTNYADFFLFCWHTRVSFREVKSFDSEFFEGQFFRRWLVFTVFTVLTNKRVCLISVSLPKKYHVFTQMIVWRSPADMYHRIATRTTKALDQYRTINKRFMLTSI